MKAEPLETQRRLVGLRLRMADAEIVTKYVFPFVDSTWSIVFTVVDGMAVAPRVLRGSPELRSGVLIATEPSSALEPLTTVPVKDFEAVVHFDPWWAFRGVAGVDRERIDAVLATNIAGTFNHEGATYKLHDLGFDPALKSLDAVIAKDPVFRTVSFRKGDIDLLSLRKPVRK